MLNGDDPILRREFIATTDRIFDRIRYVKELQDELHKSVAKALELQARETERRLEGLNHEYSRADDERSKVVSAEKFDEFRKSYEVFKEATQTYIANQQGRFAVVGAVIVFAAAAINYVIRLVLG